MTASADVPQTPAITLGTMPIVCGVRMILRAIHKMVGAALIIASMAIWFVGGANGDHDMMLFNLVLSFIAFVTGLAFLRSSESVPSEPEVQIDTIRREVRVVKTYKRAAPEVIERFAFADLARAEHTGNSVRIFGGQDTLLAEVTVARRDVLNSLLAGLRDAGKLA